MPRLIAPLRRALDEPHVLVPVSKSVAVRELVLSAVARGTSSVDLGALDPGEDVWAMLRALETLGYAIRSEGAGRVSVAGGGVATPEGATVDAADAGTVARFGLALASLGSARVTIDGSARLRERPLAPLLRALGSLGARVEGDRLPVSVTGPLRGGSVEVSGSESSQFASALLLVGARMRDGLALRVTGDLVSAPFVDLTVEALGRRAVEVRRPEPGVFVVSPQEIRARDVVVPGDVTAATYPAAAAAILGGGVIVEGVDARSRPGEQGDARFFDLLEEMGCQVDRGRTAVTVRRAGKLRGITANVRDCSDVFPTLAVVAARASGPSELDGIGHTRRQESDRVAAVAAGLRALGGKATEYADSIRIEPVPLAGGVVDAAGDHRIAMAFSILGLAVPGVAIEGTEAVAKTFPGFYDLLAELRA